MPCNTRVLEAFAPIFLFLGLIFAVSVFVLSRCDIAVATDSLMLSAKVAAICAIMTVAAIRFSGPMAVAAVLSLSAMLLLPAPLALFSYAMAALGAARPLVDAQLAQIDSFLGFDWPTVISASNQSPLLIQILGHAYHGTIVPMFYVVILLNVLRQHDRIIEFVWLLVLSCIVASILSGLFPALGAYVHFQPPEALRTAISSDAGVWHLEHYERLRAGTFKLLVLTESQGLITFPSYHTATALIFPIVLRGLGGLTGLAWAVAAVIVVSTIPIGGHYLIDVIAGAGMVYACHWLVRKLRIDRALTASIQSGSGLPAAAS